MQYNYILYASLADSGGTEGARQQSNGLARIPEDHLLELDRLVGFDGMRNRSDVIREAVRRMLSTPLPGKGDRVEVDLGPELTVRLRDYCKIVGEPADVVLRQSAREMIRKEMIEGATVVDLLRKRMDELRFRHDDDSNA